MIQIGDRQLDRVHNVSSRDGGRPAQRGQHANPYRRLARYAPTRDSRRRLRADAGTAEDDDSNQAYVLPYMVHRLTSILLHPTLMRRFTPSPMISHLGSGSDRQGFIPAVQEHPDAFRGQREVVTTLSRSVCDRISDGRRDWIDGHL